MNLNLRIVHVTPFFVPVVGGLEVGVFNLVKEQSKRHKIYVITTNVDHFGNRVNLGSNNEDGISVIRLNSILKYKYGSLMYGLAGILKKIKPDVLHFHVYRHPHTALVNHIKQVLPDSILILNTHDPFPPLKDISIPTYIYYKVFDVSIGKAILKKYDAIVSTNYYGFHRLLKIGAPRERTYIIPLPVSEHFYAEAISSSETVDHSKQSTKKDKVLLYVGRMIEQKNIENILKIVYILRRKLRHDVKLLTIGDGEKKYLNYLRGKYNSLVNEEYAWMHLGPLPQSSLKEYYNRSFLSINLSSYESFGMSIAESIACGTPAITTSIGGPEYMLEGRLRFLLCFTLVEVIKKIDLLLKDEDLYEDLSKECRRRAAVFNPSSVTTVYDKIYSSLSK